MKSKAFTLIELLVVIAIIAILAAILFPVFAQAKAAAKRTQDLSNVKNLTLGITMYGGDTDDCLPPAMLANFNGVDTTRFNATSWKDSVLPYIKNGGKVPKPNKAAYMLSEGKPGGIFESPLSDNAYAASANTAEYPAGSGGDATTRFARSYAVNWDAGKNELGPAKAGMQWYDDTASIWPYVLDGTNKAGSGNMTSLQNPAGTVMINSTRTQFAFTYAGEIIHDCDVAYCGTGASNKKTRLFSVGNGLMNLGFFDGHAKAIKGKKAIADDLFDNFTTWWTQPSGWFSKSDVLQRLNNFPEWQ